VSTRRSKSLAPMIGFEVPSMTILGRMTKCRYRPRGASRRPVAQFERLADNDAIFNRKNVRPL
jgi:hypothetical protein